MNVKAIKMKRRENKTILREAMHYLIKFLNDVEAAIDSADEKKDREVLIEDVFPNLYEFLKRMLEYRDTEENQKISLRYYGGKNIDIRNEKSQSFSVDIGNKGGLAFTSDDLFSYYGLMKIMKRSFKISKKIDLEFIFIGEKRYLETGVTQGDPNISHSDLIQQSEGSLPGIKIFSENAKLSIDKGYVVSMHKGWRVTTFQRQIFHVAAPISTNTVLLQSNNHLINLEPKLDLRDRRGHGDEYKGQEVCWVEFYVNDINSRSFDFLNELIRAFFIYYGASFYGYKTIVQCSNCEKILVPLRRSENSSCSASCRGKKSDEELGLEKSQCRKRQLRWFANNLNKAVWLDREKCENCNEYNSFEMSIGGKCGNLIKICKIEKVLTDELSIKAREKFNSRGA